MPETAHPHPVPLKSAQARYAQRAAEACGYGFRSLDGADGYLFEVSDGARRAVFAAGAGTPYALNDARAASIARDKAFCAETLRRAGVAVLPGQMFFVTKRWAEMRSPGREPEDARNFAAATPYPIFCKPLSASNGLYAEVIDDAGAFENYMERVSREHFAILVQPFIRAPEYRVFVLNGRVLFSYCKTLPRVCGDGRRSLRELLADMPSDPEALALRPRGRNRDGVAVAADDVPAKDQWLTLEGPANRAVGGGADALREGAPASLARLALDATAAIGLRLAAVDVFDLAGDLSDLAVIEVNSNPMIATLEDNQHWHLIVEIWRANIEAALR